MGKLRQSRVAASDYDPPRPGWRNWSDAIGLNPIVLRGVWVRVPPRARRIAPRASPAEALIAVRLQPRARRDEVVGERAGAVVIRVAAPPVDGKANAALCACIARSLRMPGKRVSVVRDLTSRDKVVRVEGLTNEFVREALLGQRAD
jgi:uncharacterized protein